jgi:hypothetical protein
MYAKAKKAADGCIAASKALVARNEDLMDAMDDLLAKQRKAFNSIGISLGEPNPIVKNLRDKLSGVDEFAELAREHEKRICDGLGLTPAKGWDLALAAAEMASGGRNTMGELSSIISSGAPRTGGRRSKAAGAADASVDGGRVDAPSKKTKAKVRRLKI